jgi:hypothetical protein
MTTYTIPDDRTDAEAAALEPIVRLPASLSDRLEPPTPHAV